MAIKIRRHAGREPTATTGRYNSVLFHATISTMMTVRTGIDLCDPERIRRAVERHGERFLRHVFTEGEIKRCSAFSDPSLSYAARFAAKEAVMKALGAGIGRISFTEIEIVPEESGRPRAVLGGKAKRIADELGVTSLDVSLTHVRGMAAASAVALVRAGGAIMPPGGQ